MTTIQIDQPDQLAQEAQVVGLLTQEAIEAMLREQPKKQAGERLREFWNELPAEELTPEIEQEIVDKVRAVRAVLSPSTGLLRDPSRINDPRFSSL